MRRWGDRVTGRRRDEAIGRWGDEEIEKSKYSGIQKR